MFVGTQSIWIPVAKRRVYEIAETYPHFVRFFSEGSRVLQEDDRHLRVQVRTRLLGFIPTRWLGEAVKERYETIRFTQTEGLFRNLTALWSFGEVDNGTRVSIRTSFSKPYLGSWGERILGKFVVEATTRKILKELKYQVQLESGAVST